MNREQKVWYFRELKKHFNGYSDIEVENGIMFYCLSKFGSHADEYRSKKSENIAWILESFKFPVDIEYIVDFFESLVDKDAANEKGIVFTPKIIADYIVEKTLQNLGNSASQITLIDPGCGSGIFLVAAAEYLYSHYSIPMHQIINQLIYGLDIDENNVRRCKLVLRLLSTKYQDENEIKPHVVCGDTLKVDWVGTFGCAKFDFIIGNPPYVNPHDLPKETVDYLKASFETTKSGVFNIFYAFIEQSMKYLSYEGCLGFIVPNNFLTIKSAKTLRNYLQKSKYIKSILDFGENLLFKPIRTYSCILLLDKTNKENFEYSVISQKSQDISLLLKNAKFVTSRIDRLDSEGWKLVDDITLENLSKIEKQKFPLKSLIHTGIATLKDEVFMVDCDSNGFFKYIDGKRYDIDSELVVPIFKIPELKRCSSLSECKRHIIFPYHKKDGKFVPIKESVLKIKFPTTYEYLLISKEKLDKRDKGKKNPNGWFAYGRSQGLNRYGKKLLFPTFSKKPSFSVVEDELVLFCNGYAIFENELEIKLLCRILNSKIMDYYISQTSYPIEGGFYCYQKKFLEKFSVPNLSENEKKFIEKASTEKIDDFLIKKYDLRI